MVDQQLSRFLQSRSLLRMLSPLIPRHVKGFQHSKWNKAYDNDRSNPEKMRASHDAPALNDVILNVKIGNKASPKLISATFTVYLPYCLYCHLFCKTENPFGLSLTEWLIEINKKWILIQKTQKIFLSQDKLKNDKNGKFKNPIRDMVCLWRKDYWLTKTKL